MKKLITLVLAAALASASVFAGGEQEPPFFPDPVPGGGAAGPAPENRAWAGGPGWIEDPGVLIAGVLEDGPAAAAGLRRGDIIVAIDERNVNNLYDVRRVLSDYRGGDTVSLSVKRGDEHILLELKLDDRLYHPPIGVALAPGMRPGMGSVSRFDRKTAPFPDFAERGALVAEVAPDGPAADAGIIRGDIITAVNGTALGDEDLAVLIRELEPGDTVSLNVLRTDRSRSAGERPVAPEAIVIVATLGTGEDGGPYLGIQFIPFPGNFRPRAPFQGLPEGTRQGFGSGYVM